jgi:hypothetical protein
MLKVGEDNSKCTNGQRFAPTDMRRHEIVILKLIDNPKKYYSTISNIETREALFG